MMGLVSSRSVAASSHSLRTSSSPQIPAQSNFGSNNRNLQLPLDLTSTINGLLSAAKIQAPDVEEEQNVLGITLSLSLTDMLCTSPSVQEVQCDHDPMLDNDTTQRMKIDFIGMSLRCTFRWEYFYPSFIALSGGGTGVAGPQPPSSLSMDIDYTSEDDKLDPPYDVKVSSCNSDLDINIEFEDDSSDGVGAAIANALATLMDDYIEEEMGYVVCDGMPKLLENSEDEGLASGVQLFLIMATPAKPTSSPTTGEPTLLPSKPPVTLKPTAFPSKSPVTLKPTAFPSESPVTRKQTASPSKSQVTLKPTAFPFKSPEVMLDVATPTQFENCYVLSMNEQDCKAMSNCEWTIDNAGITLCQEKPIVAENCYVLSTAEEECASASNCEWVIDDLGNNLCRDTSFIANPAETSSAECLSLLVGYYLVVLFASLVA